MQYLILILVLILSACSRADYLEAPVDNPVIDFVIQLESGSSQSPALYSAVTSAREDLIKRVSVYVFSGETLTTTGYFGSIQNGGYIRLSLPTSGQKRSAFVVANIQIADPTSKSDLLQKMADVEIGTTEIPEEGMPMASRELEILPGSLSVIPVELQRCHSALYVETPNGRNSDYDIVVFGEQRRQGALVIGNNKLAPLASNNMKFTPNYPFTATAKPEPVTYFYPTDGTVQVFIRLQGKLDSFRYLHIPEEKAKQRNKKYLLRIVGSPTKASGESEYPKVELISL